MHPESFHSLEDLCELDNTHHGTLLISAGDISFGDELAVCCLRGDLANTVFPHKTKFQCTT